MYLLGTSHPISGSGEVAVSQPIGLRLTLDTVPIALGRRSSNPVEYFRLGHVTLGNTDGFLPSIRVAHPAQLHYPVADGMTRLAFDLAAGVTVHAQELVAGAAVAKPEFYIDRNPVHRRFGQVAEVNGGVAIPSGLIYTVPAGRRFALEYAEVGLAHETLPVTPYFVQYGLILSGVYICWAELVSDNTHVWMRSPMSGGPTFMGAGEYLQTNGFNYENTGVARTYYGVHGTEFDA